MRRPWVAGNWKMNGSREVADSLLSELAELNSISEIDICVAPPAPYWLQTSEALKGGSLRVLAQTVSEHGSGAYTGELSSAMLKDCGVAGALVGHSERRQLFAEDDAAVAAKFKALCVAGLQPILCVGETLAEREAGETLAVVSRQLLAVLEWQGPEAFDHAVLAYEPVWAIGTGLTASPVQAQAVHASLRAVFAAFDAGRAVALRIVYGGSVKASNAQGLFAMPDIDGALVGGASLQASEFVAICQAARQSL
ncbi:MAG: triose-phosphate isomerase [Pseudomonadota bacterium]